MEKKKQTLNIKDIALQAGVSIATVSRVINGSRQVSPENRRKVEEVLSRVSYTPNPAARNLVLRREPTRLVVVTLPSILSPFFSELLAGVREGLAESPYRLVLQEAPDPHRGEHLISSLDRDGIGGMLIFCRSLSRSERTYLRQRKIPYLLLDYLSPEDHSFAVDNRLGGALAAQWLQERGSLRPLYIGAPPVGGGVAQRRWEGFLEFFLSRGITPSQISTDMDGTSHDFMEKGYWLTQEYFAYRHEKADGVFYFCDEMALGGVQALRELGLDVPIVGFDGWEPARMLGIATVAQPARQMGRDGAELVVKGSLSLNGDVINRLYPPQLLPPPERTK